MKRRLGLNAPRVLLVEGTDEQYVLPELLELAGVPWAEPPPVELVSTVGYPTMLDPDYLKAAYQTANRAALGLVVDANGDPLARWQQVRGALASIMSSVPLDLPEDGFISTDTDRPAIGAWLMPDNLRSGMLETLLLAIRQHDAALGAHVDDAVAGAKQHGAPFRDAHLDKARLHTWLAWQDPPGQALGTAAKAHHFDVTTPEFARFAAWFRRLFST